MTPARALEAFAQVLRGYQGMGLSPTATEDTGGSTWERLDPALRERWIGYAAQVLHSATVLEARSEPVTSWDQIEREKREAAIVAAVERVIGSEAAGGRQPVCQMCRKRWSEVKLAPCTSPWRRKAPPFRDGDHQWEFEDVRGDE